MIKIPKDFINFNKEILFGEVGAIAGAQVTGNIISEMTSSVQTISYAIVGGSIVGASIFWIAMRIHNKTKKNKLSTKKFIEDIAYFTPVAFILTSILYYPSLFLISEYLIENYGKVTIPIIISQLSAFLILLVGLNIYKHFLFKFTGKKL